MLLECKRKLDNPDETHTNIKRTRTYTVTQRLNANQVTLHVILLDGFVKDTDVWFSWWNSLPHFTQSGTSAQHGTLPTQGVSVKYRALPSHGVWTVPKKEIMPDMGFSNPRAFDFYEALTSQGLLSNVGFGQLGCSWTPRYRCAYKPQTPAHSRARSCAHTEAKLSPFSLVVETR